MEAIGIVLGKLALTVIVGFVLVMLIGGFGSWYDRKKDDDWYSKPPGT